MNLEQEVKGWSDAVLRMLAEEEDISDEFRIVVNNERDLRPHAMITLTADMLHSAGTDGYSGWNREQLRAIGINWPPPPGWLCKTAGKEVTMDQWRKFLSLRGKKRNASVPPRPSRMGRP